MVIYVKFVMSLKNSGKWWMMMEHFDEIYDGGDIWNLRLKRTRNTFIVVYLMNGVLWYYMLAS